MLTLRFSRGNGLAGWVVRTFTWSPFAHCGFKLDNGMVLDATPELGVTLREARDDATTQYWRLVDPPPGVEERALKWAMDQRGLPYDWTAIEGFIMRRDWHKNDRFFCSELIEAAFDRAGWPLVRDSWLADRITPRDLLLSERITRVRP